MIEFIKDYMLITGILFGIVLLFYSLISVALWLEWDTAIDILIKIKQILSAIIGIIIVILAIIALINLPI